MPEPADREKKTQTTSPRTTDPVSGEHHIVFILNRDDNTIVDVNNHFENRLGTLRTAVNGKPISETGILSGASEMDAIQSMHMQFEGKERVTVNFRAASGQRVPLLVSACPMKAGVLSYTVFVASDPVDRNIEKTLEIKNEELEATNEELLAAVEELETTNDELSQAYHDLQNSETRYRDFFESSIDGIILYDLGCTILDCNMAFTKILGYRSRDELKGLNIKDITPIEYHDEERKIIEQGLAQGGWPSPYEKEYFRKDGSRVPVSIQGWVIRDSRDKSNGMWTIVRDMSDRRRAEQIIEENRSLLETAIRQLPVAVTVSDIESRQLIHVNKRFEYLTGYTRDEVIGKTALELGLFDNPEDHSRLIEQSSGASRDIPFDITFRFRSGNLFYGLVSTSRIKLGQKECLLTAIQDVSRLMEMAKEKEKIQSQLIHMQKMEAIGTLAGGLAHDFNNILGGIVGSLELLKRMISREQIKQNETIQGYISTALGSCTRATDLTRQLLSLTRKNELQTIPVDLTLSLKHVMKLCLASLPKSVDISFSIPDKPILVMCDPAGIEQAVLNMCLNASQSMTVMREEEGSPAGGTLTVILDLFIPGEGFAAIDPKATDDIAYARITIKDTGVGIKEDIIPRIYEPFFTTHAREKGTGLGLAIVYNTIQQHSGFITLTSKENEGSVFTVYLPALPDVTGENETAGESRITSERKGKILVIDDEKDLLSLTKEMLALIGYEPFIASSAEEGLKIIKEHHDELKAVILDMSMPVMSGYDVFHAIHAIDKRIRVLLTSGFSYLEQAEKAVNEGAGGFLQKPYSMASLAGKLDQMMK